MSKPTKPTGIQERVLAKIANGEVAMRSKLYFTLAIASGVVAAVAAVLLMADFVRIASLSIRIGTASTPAYGARANLLSTLETFPWWILLLALVMGVLSVWLLRRYGRLYRYSVLYVVAAFVLLTAALGVGASYVDGGKMNSRQGSQIQRGHGR